MLSAQATLSGELRKHHLLTLDVIGPQTSEDDRYNPFLHYRMDVTFRHDSVAYRVPGFFAADGDAGNTGATSGKVWRCRFAPDHEGDWSYKVSFRRGGNVAVSDNPQAGEPVPIADGLVGTFAIGPDNRPADHPGRRGRLLFHHRQYPVWAETGEYFYKVGVDAPENLLSYADFDGTFHDDGQKDDLIKTWAAHEADWRAGDPTWAGGRGKGLIGAINYLASEGLNNFSFLTLNIAGDDRNVFPYISYDNYERIDVSKMDQWNVVFQHGTDKGMFLHFKMSEVENQGLLDGGDLGPQRKLYYRELMARFGHHPALNWNIGEENGKWRGKEETPVQTTTQRLAMARYFYEHDPYRHHVVIHNGQPFYDLLTPESHYTGLSLQTDQPDFSRVYDEVRYWHGLTRERRMYVKPWAIAVDEPGDAQHSLVPDADNTGKAHNDARQNALWASLLAGAWGTEWYFGYKHAHSDLTLQDFRSRDLFWDQCRHLLTFIEDHRPDLPQMVPANDLTTDPNDWVLAQPDATYLIYLKRGNKSTNTLTTADGPYRTWLLNPRTGKYALQDEPLVATGGLLRLPQPTSEVEMDWVLLVVRE
ncbi:DUF5060 domain-containing protein [Lewinella sp. 4G2]|nr:DUF5060 domain-containing protein [Lewinella sp. 4G2]